MSTTQDYIRHDNALIKEKKDGNDINADDVCLSPSSKNSDGNKALNNVINTSLSKKQKCFNEGCNKRPAKIVGDCKYCNNKFCSAHRLPEIHFCKNICEVKNKSKQILADKLNNEKCVGEKVAKI
jgi:predicted nucleic acid binding AN1-type Zn finger protein